MNKKIILLIVVSFFMIFNFSKIAFATTSMQVSGRLVDAKTNTPLSNIEIKIFYAYSQTNVEWKIAGYTDSNGNFNLNVDFPSEAVNNYTLLRAMPEDNNGYWFDVIAWSNSQARLSYRDDAQGVKTYNFNLSSPSLSLGDIPIEKEIKWYYYSNDAPETALSIEQGNSGSWGILHQMIQDFYGQASENFTITVIDYSRNELAKTTIFTTSSVTDDKIIVNYNKNSNKISTSICGDGVCDSIENSTICPADCKAISSNITISGRLVYASTGQGVPNDLVQYYEMIPGQAWNWKDLTHTDSNGYFSAQIPKPSYNVRMWLTRPSQPDALPGELDIQPIGTNQYNITEDTRPDNCEQKKLTLSGSTLNVGDIRFWPTVQFYVYTAPEKTDYNWGTAGGYRLVYRILQYDRCCPTSGTDPYVCKGWQGGGLFGYGNDLWGTVGETFKININKQDSSYHETTIASYSPLVSTNDFISNKKFVIKYDQNSNNLTTSICGDGVCDSIENPTICPADCGVAPINVSTIKIAYLNQPFDLNVKDSAEIVDYRNMMVTLNDLVLVAVTSPASNVTPPHGGGWLAIFSMSMPGSSVSFSQRVYEGDTIDTPFGVSIRFDRIVDSNTATFTMLQKTNDFTFNVKTDQYSYSPGDSVRITAVLSGDSSFDFKNALVTTIVTDPNGNQQNVRMDPIGASASACTQSITTGTTTCPILNEYHFTGTYNVPSDASTGNYRVMSTAVTSGIRKNAETNFEVGKTSSNYVDVSVDPKEQHAVIGNEVSYQITVTDKHPIPTCPINPVINRTDCSPFTLSGPTSNLMLNANEISSGWIDAESFPTSPAITGLIEGYLKKYNTSNQELVQLTAYLFDSETDAENSLNNITTGIKETPIIKPVTICGMSDAVSIEYANTTLNGYTFKIYAVRQGKYLVASSGPASWDSLKKLLIAFSNKYSGTICTRPTYTYMISVNGLPYSTKYQNTIQLPAGGSTTVPLLIFPSSTGTSEGVTTATTTTGTINPASSEQRIVSTITGKAVATSATTQVPVKEVMFKFTVQATQRDDSTVSASDGAILYVDYSETPQPPPFPESEKVDIELRNGWNLLSAPGYGYFSSGTCSDVSKPVAFIYLTDQKRYASFDEALSIMGTDKLKEYLGTHSFWVYSYENCQVEFNVEKHSTYSGLQLDQGWNMLDVTNDMVGETMSNIKGTCTFENLYNWNADSQSWTSKTENDLIDKMGYGIIVKVSSTCNLNANVIQVPTLK